LLYEDPTTFPQYGSCTFKAATPDSYILSIEDGPKDDYDDCVIIVDPFAEGQVEGGYTWESGHAYWFELLDPDDEVVIDKAGRRCSPFLRGQRWDFKGAGRCSYGMNVAVDRFTRDGNKVLLVEYGKIVARVVPPNTTDLVSGGWMRWVRPRHQGVLNVLFGDGRVETFKAGDINPTVLKLLDDYWVPSGDRRPGT
jgi:prepilin-type processing-associated H-X9-DG protein